MKRIAAAPLWFLVGWFLGSAVAWVFGVGPFLAPTVGLLLAGFVVVDPARLFWVRNETERAHAKERLTAISAQN